jgi:hypothetical protein
MDKHQIYPGNPSVGKTSKEGLYWLLRKRKITAEKYTRNILTAKSSLW